MKNVRLLLFLTFLISTNVFGQVNTGGFQTYPTKPKINRSRFYLLGGFDLSGNSYSYQDHKQVLRCSDLEDSYILYNFHGALQYRPTKTFSIEVGTQGLYFFNQCVDTAYLKRHPENKNDLLNLSGSGWSQLSFGFIYTSYYLTATRYFPLSNTISFYTSGGFTTNHLPRGTAIKGTNSFYDNTNNETLLINYSAVHNYYGMVAEGGFNFLMFKQHITFYTGFRYNTGFKQVVNASYVDIQNNTVINRDHLSTNGTYMGFVCRVGINLFSTAEPIHINPPSITMPHISLPHRTSRHYNRNKKEQRRRKHRKHPIVQTPRFIIQ